MAIYSRRPPPARSSTTARMLLATAPSTSSAPWPRRATWRCRSSATVRHLRSPRHPQLQFAEKRSEAGRGGTRDRPAQTLVAEIGTATSRAAAAGYIGVGTFRVPGRPGRRRLLHGDQLQDPGGAPGDVRHHESPSSAGSTRTIRGAALPDSGAGRQDRPARRPVAWTPTSGPATSSRRSTTCR
jgi:hypothetical protein